MLEWIVYPLMAYGVYWFYQRIIEELPEKPTKKELTEEEHYILYGTKFEYIPPEIKQPEPERQVKTITINERDATEDYQRLQVYMEDKRTYMKSQSWNQKRISRLDLDNFTCQLCGSSSLALDVHHLKYVDIPNESLSDLISLCRGCHTHLHEKIGYPQSMSDYEKTYYWESI